MATTSTLDEQERSGQIPYFLQSVLSTPVGALPLKPLWIVTITFDSNIRNTISMASDYEPQMPEKWAITDALNTVTSSQFQETKGCMFVQGINVPGESLGYSQEGSNYNGFIRGGIGTGRNNFDPLRITFLNTNVSFVDNVIRPWVVMTSHLGMIARPKSKKYRTDITIYKLGIYDEKTAPYITQRFNFWGCCPINVLSEEYTYNESGGTPTKTAEFVYHWYTTSSNSNPYKDKTKEVENKKATKDLDK